MNQFRVLMVHNKYLIRGGEDVSFSLELNMLRSRGNHVEVFLEDNQRISSLGLLSTSLRTIWSLETYRKVRERLRREKFDLVHIQNFFPLISPSVVHAALSEGVPIVQTLRNYRFACLNGYFYRDHQICEKCLQKKVPVRGVIYKCYRNNRTASSVVALMLSIHNMLHTFDHIHGFIALTDFAKRKYIDHGFPAEKIWVKPNFLDPVPEVGSGKGNYALLVSRLSPEKGINIVINAWKRLGHKVPLKIIGDGPESNLVHEAAAKNSNIEWLGRKSLNEVLSYMGNAKVVIFPTLWYETFGRVVIEAFSKGTPVIASNIGAVAELVDEGRTGFLFQPGSSSELLTKVELITEKLSLYQTMRNNARREFIEKYSPETNYQMLKRIYENTIESHL